MSNPVIQPNKVNRVIVDVLRPELERALADITYSLKDPLLRTLPTLTVSQLSRFIEVDFPKRAPEYPIIVLQQINTPGKRLDVRKPMFVNVVTIRHLIVCKYTTQGHNILNGLREFYERDFDTLCTKGLIEPTITGSSTPAPSDEAGTFTLTLTIECLVYSVYTP